MTHPPAENNKVKKRRGGLVDSFRKKAVYLWDGIWLDRRNTFGVRFLKTINLTVRTLIDPRLQTRAYALTFNTILSIVPAFALLLAICKGFGLQNILQSEVVRFFPSQKKVTDTLMTVVDSYLTETSHGIFVGIGIIFLFYTVVTLMSEIEGNFNWIWGARDDRSLYRKMVDYIAICLLVPVMLICSAGMNIFMNDTFREHFRIPFISPIIGFVLDLLPFVLVCAALTLSFYWIPHAKVKFKYAAVSGLLCGVAFQILQLVFLNGQIMVSRYNAIYGSLSFLVLFLLWLMISWLIVLSGCVITYSAQYVFCFPFTTSIDKVSRNYDTKVLVTVASIIAARHLENKKPLSIGGISVEYSIPVRMVSRSVERLKAAGLVYFVMEGDRAEMDAGVVPAFEVSSFTLKDLLSRLDNHGEKNFIPGFNTRFAGIVDRVREIREAEYNAASSILLKDAALTVK